MHIEPIAPRRRDNPFGMVAEPFLQQPGLDHMRCKRPEMIARKLWVTLLAYNLVRRLIAISAAAHDTLPRQLGFTLACQVVLSSWLLLASEV